MKDKTLYMIGNAHIDPVWLWRWQEGFQEVKATFRSALDRMQEDEDFVFVASSAVFYAWVEQNDPAMFVEIQARVAEGRWGLVGGWWIEPDCSVPGGESFVRQGLYGQRYFHSRFGRTARVGYCPDSFGHNAMLPQILKRSGLDFYVFMRPGPHENAGLHHLFWWEADDGSRVLAYRIPYTYAAWGPGLEAQVRRCADELGTDHDALMCFYGVGNHGGGPTQENIALIHTLDEDASLPRLAMASPEQFFDMVAARDETFPVVHDELQHHASGCYAAHSGVKRWNRQAEQSLLAAEKWSAIASWVTGLPYPADDFERAWKNILFNQFHDILAGTSIETAYDDAHLLYDEARAIADRAYNAAVQSLAWQVHVEPESDMTPLLVFNPHGWTSRVPVEVTAGWFRDADYILVDETGATVPVQQVRSEATVPNVSQLSFVAELPPLGYRTYRLAKDVGSKGHGFGIGNQGFGDGWVGEAVLENGWFRLVVDAEAGGLRLFDKRVGAEVFAGAAARAVVIGDPSDTWSHGVFRFDSEVGTFAAEGIRLLEHGPVKSVVRVTSVYGASRLIQDFTLYETLPQIDVHVTVDWHEQFKLLKLRFPFNLTETQATYEIPYGHIVRSSDGEEEPGQSWVDVSGMLSGTDVAYGVSVLNDSKYSFSVDGAVLGMTVLRSPIYAHHVPFVPDPDGVYTFIDQGIQYFAYVLLPHTGTWKDAGTVQRAAELNQRPVVLKETYHPWGTLPQREAFVAVEPDNVVVSVLKQAEDDNAWILRCCETHNVATQATIRLPCRDRIIRADFGPCEIKTFRIPKDGTLPVVETDLLEWE
jgi:alpha-mannosidase